MLLPVQVAHDSSVTNRHFGHSLQNSRMIFAA
jgi:hypothetical protein